MAPTGPARPCALRLCITLAILGLWMVCVHIYPAWRERGGDWAAVAIGARVAEESDGAALYARSPGFLLVDHPLWKRQAQALDYHGNLYPFLYPPLMASTLLPLARLDLAHVRPVILHGELVLLLFMIALASWQWRPDGLGPGPMTLMLLWLTLSAPLLAAVTSLNIHPLVLACVVLAMVAAQRNAPRLAGIALGGAAFIKIVPVILLLYWIAQGRWACVAWCAATLLSLALLSLGLFGLPAHLQYLGSLADMSASVVPSLWNKGLPALLYGVGVEDLDNSKILRLVPMPEWIRWSSLVALLAGLALTIRGARRHRDDPPADAAGMISTFLIATLSSPAAWSHYYTILLPAFLIWSAMTRSRMAIAAMAIIQAVLVSWLLLGQTDGMRVNGWPGWAVGGEFFAALLLVAALLISRESRQPLGLGKLFGARQSPISASP